jgi:hypothetical protein
VLANLDQLETPCGVFNRYSEIFRIVQIRTIDGSVERDRISESFNLMGGHRAGARADAGADQGTGACTHAGRAADNRAATGANRAAGEGAAAHRIPASREAKQQKRGSGGHCEFAFHNINSWVKWLPTFCSEATCFQAVWLILARGAFAHISGK